MPRLCDEIFLKHRASATNLIQRLHAKADTAENAFAFIAEMAEVALADVEVGNVGQDEPLLMRGVSRLKLSTRPPPTTAAATPKAGRSQGSVRGF